LKQRELLFKSDSHRVGSQGGLPKSLTLFVLKPLRQDAVVTNHNFRPLERCRSRQFLETNAEQRFEGSLSHRK